MGKVMDIEIGGIKCDAHGCGYRDDDVKFADYAQYIDRPCPKCGSNLLTKEAMADVNKYIALAKFVNKWFGWMVKDDAKFDAAIRPQYDDKGMPSGVTIEKYNK